MKEVNSNIQTDDFDVKSILDFLFKFIKQPHLMITQIPNWSWKSLFVIQLSISIASGLIAGILKLNFYRIFAGLIIMPIVSTISSLLLASVLYYYFQFFENKTESFKKIFSLVIIASIPFYLFQILSEYFSPISIIGFSMTSLLLIIGLNEIFKVNKKRCYQIVSVLFALVLITWITSQFGL